MKRKISLILVSLLLGCGVNLKEEENRYPMYEKAYLYITDGKYDEAIDILITMRDYLDSEDLYYEAVYRRLLNEVEVYFQTQEGFAELEKDYLILSYDHRNEMMEQQQGLYLELLIIATKINLGQSINCDEDFYYYQPESFWDMAESVTVLNSVQLIEVIKEYKANHEKDCILK